MVQMYIWHTAEMIFSGKNQMNLEFIQGLFPALMDDEMIFCSWSWPGMIEEQNILLISLSHVAFDHENLIEAWQWLQFIILP